MTHARCFRGVLLAAGFMAVIIGCSIRPLQPPVDPPPPAMEPGSFLLTAPVVTMDERQMRGEGLVVRRGFIERVNTVPSESDDLALPRLRIPIGGVVFPGIIESHAHLSSLGRTQRQLDVRAATSAAAVAQRVAERVSSLPPGTPVLGRGWNQELWGDRTFPDRSVLDAVTPRHPVALTRVDGHALWVNSRALEAAGIGPGTPNPAGGEIVRDGSGRPTGILVDAAMELVQRLLPKDTDPRELNEDFLNAQAAAFSVGITTFVDAGAPPEELAALYKLYEAGSMKLRVYAMAGIETSLDLQRIMGQPPVKGHHRDRLSIRALKLYADGALGSRGAWMLDPYSDRPGHVGLPRLPPEFIELASRQALERGYQVCVHGIGDRAVRETLNAFERALGGVEGAQERDHRFRIEHSQLIHPADVPRFRALGVLPSMQACHCTSDGPWVADRIGAARASERAYVWRSLLQAGSVIPNGTDAPVESLSPWENLYATVTRFMAGSSPEAPVAFWPAQRMNRVEALRSLTTWGAYGIFAEERRGSLRPGFQADFIVLDRDPLTCPVNEIPHIRVLATFIEGELVWTAPGYEPWAPPEPSAPGQ